MMENLNETLKEPVCIDEEVFFGPIADKEREIRERFENVFLNDNRTVECHLDVENDISKNDSLFRSFSVEESKYESFEDSLLEDKNPQEAKHVTLRKSFDKLKAKKHGFYDSLEDVCSLISNVDKCSISCEVENNSNLNNKQNIIEDSLKNPPVATANNGNVVGEQIHFDDDSLAILELENTFDDSLEEINDVCMVSSVELGEMEDIENMAFENQNIAAVKAEQNSVCYPRNLFDTSVQIVYEKKWSKDAADQEESSGDKNMLCDSLSNSEFKDALKDSLEESAKDSENVNVLKHVSDPMNENAVKTDRILTGQNALDASVQIVYEDLKNYCQVECSPEISSSEYNEFSKDSLENCKNANKNIEHSKFNVSHSTNMNSVSSSENIKSGQKETEIFFDAVDNISRSDSNANQDFNEGSVVNGSVVPVSTSEHSTCKETFTVDSCYLKLLNDNLQIDKDLKFKLQIQVTVGDKKCQIASEEIKVLPAADVHPTDKETKLSTSIPVECYPVEQVFSLEENVSDNSNSKLNSEPEESSKVDENCKDVKDSNEFHPKEEIALDNSISNVNSKPEESRKIKEKCKDIGNSNAFYSKEKIALNKSDSKLNSKPEQSRKIMENCKKIKINEFYPKEKIGLDNSYSKENSKTEQSTEIKENCKDIKDSNEFYPKENIAFNNSNSKQNEKTEQSRKIEENCMDVEAASNENIHKETKSLNTTNVTHRAKSSASNLMNENSNENFNFPANLSNITLLQALDLHDISASLLNESVIQSNDSLLPLNLCCKDQHVLASTFRDECKENIPQPTKKKGFPTSSKKMSPNKAIMSKTPKHMQNSPSFKDSAKKLPGTKIPVRKFENFALPVITPNKEGKAISTVHSSEKSKKCQHSPHSASKKTPGISPTKTPHICKVRNTIFSKVPQIVPSKKYMNIESPVAQYIHGPNKTPRSDPVLRDCMNQPLESPYPSLPTPKSAALKATKKKA